MKILQLDIEGFRSLKNVSWKPGDLNVIIGPNGSGKSNLLRMLELISASAQGKLSKYVQSAGGMDAIVWDGAVDFVAFRLLTSALNLLFAQEENFYSLNLAKLGTSTYRLLYELLGPGFVVVDKSTNSGSDVLRYIYRDGDQAKIFSDTQLAMTIPDETLQNEETLLSLASNPFIGNTLLPYYQKQLSQWAIYQDLRVDQAAPIRQAPVSRLEERVTPDGQNLINVLHTLYTGNRTFKQDINDAMHAAFGEDFDELIFPPAADQRIQLRVRWKTLQREQSAADLSDGTLRFLFLMTVLASPNPPPLIAIDEPETGLHPSMLPIIAEFAVDAATRTQVIFTTHSSQFLDAFRDTRPTTTVAKWENGETVLKTVSDEALTYWLEEYSLGSLFRSGELEDME